MAMTAPSALANGGRTIPYDYSVQFGLGGEPGEQHVEVLSISIEAAFTAVSIGYGFVAKTVSANPFSDRGIQFLYEIFDEGTGRAFQNEPVLSTAGLGDPDGERPFRQFATPIVFEPMTTIRIEVTEASELKGSLHITLHGYKTLLGRSS
jgi:hypothetical protein